MRLTIRLEYLLLAFIPAVSSAHHSVSGRYDRDRIVEVSGTIAEVRWENPHTYIVLDAADGQEWVVEGIGRRYLKQRGLDRDMFTVGDYVTIAGLASRFDLPELFMGNMLLSDGRELLLAGGAEPRWTNPQSEEAAPERANAE